MIDKVKIIAEAGCNHNGNIKLAYKLIDKAATAKVDAIKFQLYNVNELVTKKAPKAEYAKRNTKKNQTQYEMQKKLELSQAEHFKLKKYCEKKGIEYLSSAFDIPSLIFLNKIKIKQFKIPSGEITNYPYLKLIGAFKKKTILSTGMSTMNEIKNALNILTKSGLSKNKITLLQCNTEYPTPFSDVNLKAMILMKKKFKLNVGLSDHTLGIEVPVAAVALGAKVIEKHFTLNREFYGPDHKASLLPHELVKMVSSIRNIEKAIGSGKKTITRSELKNRKIARKSIVAIKTIKKNEIFKLNNIGVKRPGTGISAEKFYKILGRKSKKNYKLDDLIKI